jgi:hypothetical protein
MTQLLDLLASWPVRHAPAPAGAAGLTLALITLAVLVVHQLRPPWAARRAPGPARRTPIAVRESQHLYWATASALVVALAVVVIERFVVMA